VVFSKHVKRFVFEYCEFWGLDVSFDKVNINDQDNEAVEQISR
jgi:hypothetical protein